MRVLKALFVTSALSIVVALCITGSALAAITSAQTSVSLDPSAPNEVQVYSSYSQDPVDQTINVSNFIMPRWDATCTKAGYLDYVGGAHPNGVIDGPDDATFNSNAFEHISNFTLNPANQQTCIGTVAYTTDESQVVVDAKPSFYNKPYLTPNYADSRTSSSISIGFDLTPNWLASNYYVTYFKRVNSGSCSSPDFDDLLTALTTDAVDVTTDLKQDHEVTVDITGLERETEYCISYHASNSAGSDDSVFWSYETSGDPPVIDGQAFSPAVSGINYDVDVTPGITTSDTILSIEYFEKADADCTEPNGGPASHDVYYDDGGGLGLRGFSSINLADTLGGLSAGTIYCVRSYAYNAAGEDNDESYQTVATIEKTAPSVDNPSISRSEDPDFAVFINATLNDHGAYLDTNDFSEYEYDIFPLEANEECDGDAAHGGPDSLAGGGGGFSGETSFELGLDEFVTGQAYCARFDFDSAWGDSYDSVEFFGFTGGVAPSFTASDASVDHTTINVTGTLNAGYLSTNWGTLSFALDGDETCADDTHVNSPDYNYADNVGEGTIPSNGVSTAITGLIPNADYCVMLVAENLMGYDESDWIPVTTGAEFDTDPPSAPTNLVASNVTQTSATLSWTASTDNVGVTNYDVIHGDNGFVGSTASTSKTVTLVCGQKSTFHVIAYDADGNESDKSDTLDITGSACPVAPPSGGGGGGGGVTPVPTKTCFAPIKPKSVSGKSGKKKMSIKLNFKVAFDGQSIAVTSKVKGTTLTFKVDGTKVTPKRGGITITATASSLVVSYKSGSKTKKLTFKTTRINC